MGGKRNIGLIRRTFWPALALLDPKKADPDMADELVRRDLGLIRADEVIVPLD